MSRPVRGAVLALLVAGCTSITSDSNGVVAIETVSPSAPGMEDRDTLNLVTLTLHARALDINGDSIAAPLVWTSADTLAVIVDSVIPYVAGHGIFGSPRLQARVGTLGSAVITYTLGPRSDTLTLAGSDSIVVASGFDVSDSLQVVLQSYNPPGPLANRRLIFTIVSPVFATPADRTVEITGHGLADTALTNISGQPTVAVTLSRIIGKTAPDSAVVTVSAVRPSGRSVPGLARPCVVYFQP
jgi:hypothetical protein